MPKDKKPKYKVVLEVLGKKWTGNGSSLLKALEKIRPSWEEIKGKGVLYVYVNDKLKHERLMVLPKIRRLVSLGSTGEINRSVLAKNLDLIIK